MDGHRADLVILKTARAHAAFEARQRVTERDIMLAAELALPHRLKRGPFHEVQVGLGDLEDRVEQIMTEFQQVSDAQPGPDSPEVPAKK